jgi:hypothetical protein
MKERKGRLAGEKRFARQVQHHARILPDRIEQDRVAEFGNYLAHNADRLGFEALQMFGQEPSGYGLTTTVVRQAAGAGCAGPLLAPRRLAINAASVS